MYTQEDYYRDLYIKDHAVNANERFSAETRCRLYESGRADRIQTGGNSYPSENHYGEEEYLRDLYLKDHAINRYDRNQAEINCRLYEQGKNPLEKPKYDGSSGRLLGILLGIMLVIFVLPVLLGLGYSAVTFIFGVLGSSDNNADGGLFYKIMIDLDPCVTGIFCILKSFRNASTFSEHIPFGLLVAILFNWIVVGLYDMSNGQSLLETIIPGCFIYPFSALLMQVIILPFFWILSVIKEKFF